MAEYKGGVGEGDRAGQIIKQREKSREEFEKKKEAIRQEVAKTHVGDMKQKFSSTLDFSAQRMTEQTIGLVKLEDFLKTRERIEREKESLDRAEKDEEERRKREEKKRRQKDREKKTKLSFNFGEEEEGEDGEEREVQVVKKAKKNPEVDTSFLPDREREEREAEIRRQLAAEWERKQEIIKNEPISITYSFWDGSGHRRGVEVRKGNSIREFLQRCLETLRKEFPDLRVISVENLMYIKEDLIIPHHYTFYDFILNKARGKSGPLFKFDVHDDVRLLSDATVEKDESHAGKIVTRSWYERNKTVFPASRWEMYDPDKDYGQYSVRDKKNKDKDSD
eukprot:comp26044_c0_seq1/m.47072 comp26044_c0_seq1/g.47072  ORF comp26044_c0_seq1/g.47072 comp26044_c0_seq1/m.47072 type:complete len:336 (-) comp26044_c0_seq1:15-1022(-)